MKFSIIVISLSVVSFSLFFWNEKKQQFLKEKQQSVFSSHRPQIVEVSPDGEILSAGMNASENSLHSSRKKDFDWIGKSSEEIARQIEQRTSNLKGLERRVAQDKLLKKLAEEDGLKALAVSRLFKRELDQTWGRDAVFSAWIGADPKAAGEWFEKRATESDMHKGGKPDMDKFNEELSYLRALGDVDPDNAIAAAQSYHFEKDGTKFNPALAATLGYLMGEQTREIAFQALFELPSVDQRYHTVRMIRHDLARVDPADSLARLGSLGLDPQQESEISRSVLMNWARFKPQAAISHALESVTSPEEQSKVVSDLLPVWMGVDPDAAQEWFDILPSEVVNDHLLIDISNSLRTNGRFDQAAGWVERIADIDLRQHTSSELYRQWERKDSNSALRWRQARKDSALSEN